jgi:hypothetical protein
MCDVSILPSNSEVCFNCWSSLKASKILDGLYLSNAETANDHEYLKSLGIKQILTIGKELTPHINPDFECIFIPIDDCINENISKYFNIAYSFIEKAPTLVHCYAGISRSATLVINYVMRKKNMHLNEALEFVRNVRPIVRPNKGFMVNLKILQEYIDNQINLDTLGSYDSSEYLTNKNFLDF